MPKTPLRRSRLRDSNRPAGGTTIVAQHPPGSCRPSKPSRTVLQPQVPEDFDCLTIQLPLLYQQVKLADPAGFRPVPCGQRESYVPGGYSVKSAPDVPGHINFPRAALSFRRAGLRS
jgi:hypothetical protein